MLLGVLPNLSYVLGAKAAAEVARMSAPKSSPVPPSESLPDDMPEIVVSARRIPWYAWAVGGMVAYVAASKLLGR